MNLLKGSYSWWQIGILKVAVLCVGIAAGAYWHEIFRENIGLLLAIAVVLGVYLVAVWLRSSDNRA